MDRTTPIILVDNIILTSASYLLGLLVHDLDDNLANARIFTRGLHTASSIVEGYYLNLTHGAIITGQIERAPFWSDDGDRRRTQ